jgi:hypothetical protein
MQLQRVGRRRHAEPAARSIVPLIAANSGSIERDRTICCGAVRAVARSCLATRATSEGRSQTSCLLEQAKESCVWRNEHENVEVSGAGVRFTHKV